MAAMAPISVNNGAATPVAVVFNPENQNSGVTTFADRTSGIALGFRRLTVSNKFASGSAVVNRAKYAVEVPVLQTVNGVTTLAYTLRANVDVILPDAATDAERKDLYAFLANGLSNALVRGALRDLDPIY